MIDHPANSDSPPRSPPAREFLMQQREWFAAGFLELPDAPPTVRMARAIRRQLENCTLPALAEGQLLYPAGPKTFYATAHRVLAFDFSHSVQYGWQAIDRLIAAAPDERQRAGWQEVRAALDRYGFPGSRIAWPRYSLGGNAYTHCIPNTSRVLAEGLTGYADRIARHKAAAESSGQTDKVHLYAGLQDVLAGVESLHARIVACSAGVPPVSNAGILPAASTTSSRRHLSISRRGLGCACQRGPRRPSRLTGKMPVPRSTDISSAAPMQPATTFVEALAAVNFLFYLDDCDSLGQLDRVLGGYYQRDIQAGRLTREHAVEFMRALWRNFDDNSAWNVALGGGDASGRAAYGEFTAVCLEAARGMRRPNLALKVRRDMPEACWQATLDALESGCGQPALYNDGLYLRELAAAGLGVSAGDLSNYAFGGCTETMVHGCSNVGSLDAGINLLEFLLETLRERLAARGTFDELMEAYRATARRCVAEMAEQVNAEHDHRARRRPQMIRTLLVDDCIETGREFNAGGARYNWSVVNVGGLANAADSLAAIRELLYERRRCTAAQYLAAMDRDFAGDEALLAQIRACPKFGNDQPEVDALAGEVFAFVAREILAQPCRRGGKFLPACLLFDTYGPAGERLGASPDGRRSGQAIADSIGPHQGRDARGPTAMLRSVARLDQSLGLGTLVLNVRLDRSVFRTPASRRAVTALIEGYFSMGGMQLQVSVIDQETIRQAIADPEAYPNLIVRIGGYSEYFNRLTPALKQTILERTEHRV